MSNAKRVLAGKWDDPSGSLAPPFRCRWFFSWTEFQRDRIAGFMAGYEGGGAFVQERFHATWADNQLVEFVWNGRDHVSGEDRSADKVPEQVEALSEEHFDVFLEWHDRKSWEDGFLCLAHGREADLMMLPDALFLEPQDSQADMARISALVERTGIMCSF